MNHRKWSLLLLTLASLTLEAFGATVTVNWTNPTTYTDGTPLPASAITRTRIEYGTCAGTAFGTKAGEFIATGSATTATSPNLAPGTWCFRALTTANGLESAPTNAVSTVLVQPPPNPPTGLTVSATVAMTVIKQRDRFVMLPVGTVPAGTACDTSQSVNGYYVVPRSAVTWSGNVRPEVVVAQCG